MEKIKILTNSPVQGDRVGHLQPVIEFLVKRGNVPINPDFEWDKKTVGTFLFQKPIDVFLVKKIFDFPDSIKADRIACYGGGVIIDMMHGLIIRQRT